jgi:hypothetical protein
MSLSLAFFAITAGFENLNQRDFASLSHRWLRLSKLP